MAVTLSSSLRTTLTVLVLLVVSVPGFGLEGPARTAPSGAADTPSVPAKVIFTKEFPGSFPAYYSITVSEDGQAVYATAPDDNEPLRFRLPEDVTRNIFQAIERLDFLENGQLESRRKVAAMGKKTLAYDGNGKRGQATYNYSESADANALAALFEKISSTEQHLLNLERTVRFDRLGVVKYLLQIEVAMNRKELVAADQFVPLLEEITRNRHFMKIAQDRAAGILQRIRDGYAPVL